MSAYENDHYVVEASSGDDGYKVINKLTSVVEGLVPHLPGAIMTADTYSDWLRKKEKEGHNHEAVVVPIR